MNISGIVVRTDPENLESVLEYLKSSWFCDAYFHDKIGKIIVTVEGENTGEEVQKLKAILKMPNEFYANLIYSYCGEELAVALGQAGAVRDAVPEELRE